MNFRAKLCLGYFHLFFQACDDLVAAVDFDDNLLVTGFEDTHIGIWSLNDAQLLGRLHGHSGGITGIKLNGILFASSSYDGTVRLWSIEGQPLAVFDEPNHLLRCIGMVVLFVSFVLFFPFWYS